MRLYETLGASYRRFTYLVGACRAGPHKAKRNLATAQGTEAGQACGTTIHIEKANIAFILYTQLRTVNSHFFLLCRCVVLVHFYLMYVFSPWILAARRPPPPPVLCETGSCAKRLKIQGGNWFLKSLHSLYMYIMKINIPGIAVQKAIINHLEV